MSNKLTLTKKTSKRSFYIDYLRTINGILNLSAEELAVAKQFLNSYNGYKNLDMEEDKIYERIYSDDIIFSICDVENLDRALIQSYIQELKSKGFLTSTGTINQVVFLKKESAATITFKFMIDDAE